LAAYGSSAADLVADRVIVFTRTASVASAVGDLAVDDTGDQLAARALADDHRPHRSQLVRKRRLECGTAQ
jgi:hypothetical protein